MTAYDIFWAAFLGWVLLLALILYVFHDYKQECKWWEEEKRKRRQQW